MKRVLVAVGVGVALAVPACGGGPELTFEELEDEVIELSSRNSELLEDDPLFEDDDTFDRYDELVNDIKALAEDVNDGEYGGSSRETDRMASRLVNWAEAIDEFQECRQDEDDFCAEELEAPLNAYGLVVLELAEV